MALILIILLFLIVAYFTVAKDVESLQYTFNHVQYLGGHPRANVSQVKYGALKVSDHIISFWDSNKSVNLFDIPIQEIKNCTLETKESLTGGKIVLLRIFACALRKNQYYIRIEFKNDVNDYNNVILYSTLTHPAPIIERINEARTSLIKNLRFETGAH